MSIAIKMAIPYKLGYLNVPTKLSSYCFPTDCLSPTFSMCKFPSRPELVPSWCINCPELQRPVIRGIEPI